MKWINARIDNSEKQATFGTRHIKFTLRCSNLDSSSLLNVLHIWTLLTISDIYCICNKRNTIVHKYKIVQINGGHDYHITTIKGWNINITICVMEWINARIDNSEKQATFGTRHIAKINKAKNIT
jgi:hypothetical protein